MSQDNLRIVIEKAVNACREKNASAFAALFTEAGEIILKKNQTILKSDLEKITTDYFSTLESININIHCILIEGNKALVEWTWEDVNGLTGQKNLHDNVISITFKGGLINRWREDKSLRSNEKSEK